MNLLCHYSEGGRVGEGGEGRGGEGGREGEGGMPVIHYSIGMFTQSMSRRT